MKHPGAYEPGPAYGPPSRDDHADVLDADLAAQVADDAARIDDVLLRERLAATERERDTYGREADRLRRDYVTVQRELVEARRHDAEALAGDWAAIQRDWAATGQDWGGR